MAKRISRIVRKQGDPGKTHSDEIFEKVENMMKNNIKRNTINLQKTLNFKHDNFDREGRGDTNHVFSHAFSELNEDDGFLEKKIGVKKSNVFGDYFEVEENLQEALLTSYDDKLQKRFSRNSNAKNSLNKQLKECLKIELKTFIENYTEKKNAKKQKKSENSESSENRQKQKKRETAENRQKQKNTEKALKQTFYELFYSKLLKILAMIYLQKKDKFFQLVRIDQKNAKNSDFYKELEATYKYYNENRKEITLEVVRSFVLMIIEFESIREEMEFFMDYHFGEREEVRRLIELEDSMFFSERKEVS